MTIHIGQFVIVVSVLCAECLKAVCKSLAIVWVTRMRYPHAHGGVNDLCMAFKYDSKSCTQRAY